MTGVEYVREICRQKGITIRKLELDLGFSNGYLNPKKTKKIPYDKAKQISAAFAFSIGISILFKKGATQGVNLCYTVRIGFYFFIRQTPDARRNSDGSFCLQPGFQKRSNRSSLFSRLRTGFFMRKKIGMISPSRFPNH